MKEKLRQPTEKDICRGIDLNKIEVSRRSFILGCLGVTGIAAFLASCKESFISSNNTKSPSPTPEKTNIPTPENYTSLKFLTNPFPYSPKMKIQQGWYYNWLDEQGKPAEHKGIDFIKGEIDDSNTWEPFDILAAADGWAITNPPSRQGNAVFIRHIVNGKDFYTYYGHLEKMEENIPPYYDSEGKISKGMLIRRGQKIGVAGASGAIDEYGNPQPKWIHLHFGVHDANFPRDPYDINGTRDAYPNPNSLNSKVLGSDTLWKLDSKN